MMTANGFGLGVWAGFGVQNCPPAIHLNRSTKLQVCKAPRLTQNPCYRLCLSSFYTLLTSVSEYKFKISDLS